MFAAQFYESDPLQWADLPYWTGVWFQTVGGFAALGLVCWVIAYLSSGPNRSAGLTGIPRLVFLLGVIGAVVCYAGVGLVRAPDGVRALSAWVNGQFYVPKLSATIQRLQDVLLTAGGFSACLAVLVPFVVDGFK